MPFKKINVNEIIKQQCETDSEFKKAWDESRQEYKLLSDFIKIRKQKGLSQTDIARLSGNKQQVISRIEKHESSPTLKTLCKLADVLDYEIQLVPKNR